MFTLKIHTVDYPQPLHTTFTPTTSGGANSNNRKPVELMGVAHLFRQLPSATHPAVTVASISARTTLVFVVAVPNYLSENDFLVFCGNHVSYFEEIIFLKNDGMEDRYSVLIKLESQLAADGFYCSYNGKRFKPEESSIPTPQNSLVYLFLITTALPSCPVCLERLDPDTSGIQSTLCDHSFHCSCVSKWTYLSCPQQDEKPACVVCGTFENLWICLICGFVGCGSSVEECGTCGYDEEEEGLDGALFSSKIEGILDEYNRLLASQLDIQRQHYESLLAEAKSRKETSTSKAVEKAVFSRTNDLEYKLEKCAEEKKAAADRNRELMKKQEFLQNKFKEIEERERSWLKSKDERILDLQEQIRDLKFYVEAQRMVNKMADSDGIRGGTVLPVEANQSSSGSGNPKRRTKSGRRRN
ncbi:brca1-associated protein [Phtheirospermum japonicum]|uniref:Brca1-associated protein n=1 Tax=Phtheirospermum japonicum TaxID=374723 RepID=A0A830BTV8_9LAMI|nr:brca1-associated protein [Phtheirospermum japonicum]